MTRYNSLKESDCERLVSGSDDFTLFLWEPGESKKHVARMTGKVERMDGAMMLAFLIGHQQLVVQVCFSPDARLIASASFDKSVKLWEAKTGKSV